MTRARDVLYVAGVKLLKAAGAIAGTRSWMTRSCRRVSTRDEDGELVAPFNWPVEQRAPLRRKPQDGRR